MKIKRIDKAQDRNRFRDCVVELQDYLRRIDPRMPPGEEIADEYIEHVFERCRECEGEILIAQSGSELAGYVVLLCRVVSEEIDDGNLEYGLIVDLLVRHKFRGQGLGAKLLEAAESQASRHGVAYLRIGALAGNQKARKMYLARGYSEYYVELEKKLEYCDKNT